MNSRLTFGWCCFVAVILVVASGGHPVAQGRTGQYAQTDIESGAKLYGAECTSCHGPNGDSIGGIDLASNRFRRAASDEDLMKLINAGIPESGMPAHNFSQAELVSLVAYLRNMRNAGSDAARLGNAGRGKDVFEGKGGCLSCHRVNGQGSRAAPDLSNVGAIRSAEVIRRNLLDPNVAMFPINRPVRAVTKEGTVINGRRLNEDPFTVQLSDERGRLVSLVKAELREYVILTQSPMPSYRGRLTDEELADVLAYLLTLKGV